MAGEIVPCPWHASDLDIKTGHSLFNPHKVRTVTYAVSIEEGSEATELPEDAGVENFPVSLKEDVIVVYA